MAPIIVEVVINLFKYRIVHLSFYLIGAAVSQRLHDLCIQLNAKVYFQASQFDLDQHHNVTIICQDKKNITNVKGKQSTFVKYLTTSV